MKKTLIVGFSLLTLSLSSIGQSLNIPFDTVVQLCPPDSSFLYAFSSVMSTSGYSYAQTTYHTETVGGTGVAMSDDAVSGPFNIGFTFNFFCNSYTQFYIGSNGWVGFSSGQTTSWVVQSIASTNANTPKNNAMIPWRDWHPGTGSGSPYIRYQTIGSAPCRKLVVSYSSIPMYSCTSTYGTFQVVFHETTNIIEMNQTNVPVCTGWGNGDGTQGLHNANGTTAVPVAGRNDSQFTATNQTWQFTPTSPITWSTASAGTVATGNCITVSPMTNTMYYASGTDCNGNAYTDSVLVVVSCIDLIVDSIDAQCTGDSTGFAIASDTSVATQGPYHFYWYNSSGAMIANVVSSDSIDTLFNIPAGTYTVLCYDVTGEVAQGMTVVHDPGVFNVVTSSIDVLCFGDSTGIAIAYDQANYSGSNFSTWDGFYSYYWSDGTTVFDSTINSTVASNTLTGLAAGTYNVTVDGCYLWEGSVTVSEPSELIASILSPSQTSCPGNFCDASAQGMGAGGVTPYYYYWTSGESTQTAGSLCAGVNIVTVTDANGCDTVASVNIISPDPIITDAFGDTLICITNPAALGTTSIGGTPPYSYIWTIDSLGGDTVLSANVGVVYPFVDKWYFVTSTDANGCIGDTADVLIKVRPPLGVELPIVDTICPYDVIDVTASGVGGDSIYSYTWSVGSFGPTATVSPDLPSWLVVTVSDLCGTPTYTDSVWIQVGGYSSIIANIRSEDDSICVGESVYLISSGRGGFKGPEEYRFKWNDASWTGNSVQFVRPLKTTSYVVSITDLCLSPMGIDTITIHVGQPDLPEVKANPEKSCTDAVVIISIDSLKEKYRYDWDLGDGHKEYNTQSSKLEHKYGEPGCYDIALSVITDFGCPAEKVFPCMVQILESPIADFINNPANPSTIEPFVMFTDQSISAIGLQWYLDRTEWTTDSFFQHEFIDTGLYVIDLVATSVDGCLDTMTKVLYNAEVTTIYIPTSFSPNEDNLNDVFKVSGEGLDPNNFEFEIFDRWGKSIFYTKNVEFGWDGRMTAGGEYAPQGSYPYIVKYIDRYGEPKRLNGQVVISKAGHHTGLK